MIGTVRVLTAKHPVRELHVLPFPSAAVARLRGGKEAAYLDHLPTALLHLRLQQVQEFAKRGIRERTSELAILEQSLEVKILYADEPVAVREASGQLVEDIISHTGDSVVQASDLPTRFLPVVRAEFATMEPLVGSAQFPQRRFEEGLVFDSLSR